jgi:hypothetical protein
MNSLNSGNRPSSPGQRPGRNSAALSRGADRSRGLLEKGPSLKMERSRSPKRQCPVCLDDLDGSVMTLDCGHSFHRNCVALWFRRSPTCPVCRSLPESEPESEDLDVELATLPARAAASLVSEPLRAARRRNADPALRRAAVAYRRARDASRQSSRAEREHRASEPFNTLMAELRTLVQIDVSRRRAAGARAAELLRTWEAPRRYSHP